MLQDVHEALKKNYYDPKYHVLQIHTVQGIQRKTEEIGNLGRRLSYHSRLPLGDLMIPTRFSIRPGEVTARNMATRCG